jgi:lauroyl/myristoyl acyltransferase
LSGIKPVHIEKRIFELRLHLETSLPARFVYIDRSMRPVFNALKQNQIMIMAADGRAGSRFFSVPCGSRIMNVSSGPFRIAASTGASLIPVFPVRDFDGVHDLHIEAPILPEALDGTLSWAEQAAQIYGKKLADWIDLRPDHYAMLMAEARVRSKIDKVPLFEDFRHDG